MNKNLLQTLSSLISKMPKKDLERNLEKAKEILKTSKKEDIEKILVKPQVSKLLGKDVDDLKNQLKNINLDELNLVELEKKIK